MTPQVSPPSPADKHPSAGLQRLYGLAEARKLLGVSDRTLRGWIAAGRIAVVKFSSRCVRIEEAELARFIGEHRQDGQRLASRVRPPGGSLGVAGG